MTLAELDGLAPNFQWSAYFAGIDAPKVSDLNVGQPDFFKGENTGRRFESSQAQGGKVLETGPFRFQSGRRRCGSQGHGRDGSLSCNRT